jgi:hypothetical protein
MRYGAQLRDLSHQHIGSLLAERANHTDHPTSWALYRLMQKLRNRSGNP